MVKFGLPGFLKRSKSQGPAVGSYAYLDPRAASALQAIDQRIKSGQGTDAMQLVKAAMNQKAVSGPTVGLPDLGFKGARQQLFQRFNLIDLYGMAHNNSHVKTAILSLRQEVFRRGLEWEPAFVYRCYSCQVDFTKDEAEENDKTCPSCEVRLKSPNPAQRVRFERLMPRVNVYGQSLIRLLQSLEDDLNIVDDAFLFMSSDYRMVQRKGKTVIKRYVKQLFRLDPIFVEFDTDDDNRPGFAHHICLAHRQNLLEIPIDEGWEHEWKGTCPHDGYPTFPVIYRYVPTRGTYGAQKGGVGANKDALYLVKGEVLHSSKFSPSELYGYSPLLALYEKVFSLIGMDRYLYDYFFERQMPQGVVTTVTDNPEDLETRKEQVLANTLNNPHYIPWLAVSSRTGQGRTEFVRFAYNLDELQFLPVQEALARAVAGVYGVPDLFMGFEMTGSGLNNESQQITRMSRGAVVSQDVYNVDMLPALLQAFGITDWILKLSSAEEKSEMSEWELKQAGATWASLMKNIGFGIKYDQEDNSYDVTGEVEPESERQPAYGGFEMGGEEDEVDDFDGY